MPNVFLTPKRCPFLDAKKDEKTQAKVASPEMVVNLLRGQNLILVDTRSAEDHKKAKLKGAINIPVTTEFIENPPTATDMTKGLLGRAKFSFRYRLKAGKQTVIMSNDGKMGVEDPAGAMALILKDSSSLSILEGGAGALNEKYPFVFGKMIPPWFPIIILPDLLFLGSEDDAKNKKHLDYFKITHILNVSSDVKNFFPEDYTYHKINLPDEPGSDLNSHFSKAFEFIEDAKKGGGKVLIHCYQGVSRSSTITLAYLMHSQSWSLKDAYDYVKSQRPEICPNPGFWEQLAAFEKSLYDGVTTVDKCIDLEAQKKEYKEKKLRKKGDYQEVGDDDDDAEEVERTSGNNGVGADDKCDLCTIL
mmetsp:Transcript_4923/g.7290  ORF Transcript_4923/g.7290 Transcript_4923/m.7290 type:complete len:361 (+) Transcript_4923:67-1149(+)